MQTVVILNGRAIEKQEMIFSEKKDTQRRRKIVLCKNNL